MTFSVIILKPLLAILSLGACRTYPDYANDFRFPILQGDISRGQQAFAALGCVQCHAVDGVELQRPRSTPLTVTLGGEIGRAHV